MSKPDNPNFWDELGLNQAQVEKCILTIICKISDNLAGNIIALMNTALAAISLKKAALDRKIYFYEKYLNKMDDQKRFLMNKANELMNEEIIGFLKVQDLENCPVINYILKTMKDVTNGIYNTDEVGRLIENETGIKKLKEKEKEYYSSVSDFILEVRKYMEYFRELKNEQGDTIC